MRKTLQNLRLLDGRQILAVVAIGLFLCAMFVGNLSQPKASAATSSTLNFQARLMGANGSIVPDGNYNIEFKLYNTKDSGGTSQGNCSGSCVWTETRTGSNTVAVSNGYFAIQLGSVSPFGNGINWDQELWLTMNIGGTSVTPNWDGEMSPRLKLTAVPYAFSAGQLTNQSGENRSTLGFSEQTGSNNILLPDESGVLCIQGSSDCGFVKSGGALTVGPSSVSITGTLSVSSLGTADSSSFLCYNSSNTIAACNTTGNGAAFTQGGNAFDGTAVLGTNNANNLQFKTNGVVRATFDTGNTLYLGNGVSAGNPSDFTLQGTGSTTTAVAGGSLTIQGGAATVGTANGGSVTITGGVGSGTGVLGLVKMGPTAFISSGTTQTFDSNSGCPDCSVAGVDSYSTIAINASVDGLDIRVPVPDTSHQVVGRVLYIVAGSGSEDFTVTLGGTELKVPMASNRSATLIWNGTGWASAAASSSADLQSAYNNAQASAGAAEIVLNSQGDAGSGGLTVRNNETEPIMGSLLEVQSSAGGNLFSINNNAAEHATNGGAEAAGASAGAFPANTWSATTGGAVDRYSSATDGFDVANVATGQSSVRVQTTAVNHGVSNRLSKALTQDAAYTVSFSIKGATSFTALQVLYSPDGTASDPVQCVTNQAVTSDSWSRVTCSFVATGSITNDNAILIRQTDATARTFYVDTLSVVAGNSAPNNVQVGGADRGGAATLFTLDRFSGAPPAESDESYLGSMYYDIASGRIQCYEAEGWGACGAAPDNIVNLDPEYAGAVVNGEGIGTITTDFCSNGADLAVNTVLCALGQARNFYKWTSAEPTQQTRSIYVTYQLPSNFNGFASDDTVQLTARVDNTDDAAVTYEMFRGTGSDIVQCFSGDRETNVIAGGGGSANTWHTYGLNGSEATGCGLDSSAAGSTIIFKINLTAANGASAYVSTLSFVTTTR